MIIRIPRRQVLQAPSTIIKPKELLSDKNSITKSLSDLGFFRLNDEDTPLTVRRCMPTGIYDLDMKSARDENGVYGLPFGKQIEVSGTADSGKTSLMLHLASVAQKAGHTVVWLETEETLSESRAAIFGIDQDNFLIKTPEYLEETLVLIKKSIMLAPKYTESDKGIVIFWDSVAATPTKNEFIVPKKMSEESEDQFGSKGGGISEFARIMSNYERKIKKRLAERNAMIIYCNQLKDKIGVSFGDKSQTYGGHALRFHCSLRFKVSHIGRIWKGTGATRELLGINMRIDNKKNKHLIPWQSVNSIAYNFDGGFNEAQGLLLALETKKLASKSGSSYYLEAFLDRKKKLKGQGITMAKFKQLIAEKPYVKQALVESLYVL